jgi:hypothetical protein
MKRVQGRSRKAGPSTGAEAVIQLVPAETLAAKEADFDARRGELPRNYDRTLLAHEP